MMKKRKLLILSAWTLSATLTLSGCGTNTTTAPSAANTEKVQVTMLVNITPNLTETWWNDLVVPFETKNSHIDVKILAPTAKGVAATLPTLIASGDIPDVVETVTPNIDLTPELLDLSSYSWANSGPLAEQYKMGGKNLVAGIGYQLQTTFFYNKKAFADAGITAPPKTMSEFETDLQKLKDAGWVPLQTAGEWVSKVLPYYMAIPTVIAKYPDWYAQINSGALTFTQTYGDTVRRFADWVDKGYIPKTDVGVKYADAEANFLAGKTAIYPMGAWFGAAEAKATTKPDIGVFRGPADTGITNPAITGNIANPYVIMKASKNQDAAAKLVEYLVTDKAAVSAQLKTDGNFRSGYEYDTDALGKEMQEIVTGAPPNSWTPSGGGYGEKTLPPGFDNEFNTQIQSILTGTSADAVLKAMDDWFIANKK